jgi:N6-L-threonylcarbamoyladenine synthase
MMRVLGIETSCDETGIAVVEDGRRVLVNEVASQIDIHARFGGVVPEIASRQHTECIYQITELAIEKGGGKPDAIAATHGPGLMGSLLVGVNFAKALAYTWKLPYIPVHHLEGHIFSVFLADEAPQFPFLTLIVSGGHTCLVRCDEPHHYELLGATRDDAVGECFDKVARLLDLPYPGGPSIQAAAESGNPRAFDFPRAMAHGDSLDFSYSGLKTAVLYKLRENGHLSTADVAASFQNAAIDILIRKTKLALEQTALPRLVVAGGVAANKLLRERLANDIKVPVFVPPFPLCVDNGAMIAAAGYSRLQHGLEGDMRSTARSTWPLA